MAHLTQVLIRPIVTEKTVAQKDKFSFQIHTKATKSDVTKAVKEFYGMDAVKVNMVNLPEKTKTIKRGIVARKKAPYRKAIVTLKKGETIDFNAFK